MSGATATGATRKRPAAEKKRVSCRLNGRMPEDRKAIHVYDRVLDEFGTNAAGDMLRRWLLSGFLVWVREGGLDNLDALPSPETYTNESNTPSNNDGVLSANESSDVGGQADSATEIASPAATAAAPEPAGFVGMLGMGLSQEAPQG